MEYRVFRLSTEIDKRMCLEHPKCLAILYFDKEGENGRCTFRSKMSDCTPVNAKGEGNEPEFC